MRPIIDELHGLGYKTLGCCCGHGKYERSIIIEVDGLHIEYFSQKIIPRLRRFYVRDSAGVYFIPELIEKKEA